MWISLCFSIKRSFLFHGFLFALNFHVIISVPPLLIFVCLIYFILSFLSYSFCVIWFWSHCCKKRSWIFLNSIQISAFYFSCGAKLFLFLFHTDEFSSISVILSYILWWVWDPKTQPFHLLVYVFCCICCSFHLQWLGRYIFSLFWCISWNFKCFYFSLTFLFPKL